MCITDKLSAKSGGIKNHQKQYVKSRKKEAICQITRKSIQKQYVKPRNKVTICKMPKKKHPKTICQREKDTLSAGDVASCGVRPSHTPASELDNLIQEQIHKRRTKKTQHFHLQSNTYANF